MKEIKGNLIQLALQGEFDVIVHGCNCFCKQGAGIAKQMDDIFNTGWFPMEHFNKKGDINKLGCIDYMDVISNSHGIWQFDRGDLDDVYLNTELTDFVDFALKHLDVFCDDNNQLKYVTVVNAYTQYYYGRKKPLVGKHHADYTAIRMCMRKINHEFKGKHIGLPLIGCGLAGGKLNIVKQIIKEELVDCKVTIVHYKK